MALSNTTRSYGSVAKTFHWLTALLIFSVIPLGWVANELAHAIEAGGADATEVVRAATLFSLHKTIGVTIFFVALARILWALFQEKPGLLNADNRPEALAAETVHWLLYGSLVFVPLTGWVHHAATTGFAPIWWPFGQSLPFVPKSEALAEITAGLHWVLIWVLVGSLGLHIAGALKHHVVDRDSTLRRMLPGRSDAPQPPDSRHGVGPVFAALVVWGIALGAGSWIGAYSHETATGEQAALDQVESEWQVTEGTLGLTVTQLGSPVDGSFADWTAAITFAEPAEPGPAGNVNVTVSIPSLTLGSVTQQALGADFFAAEEYPTARFEAEIVKTEAGYEARGPLTIRDQSVPITLPFSLDIAGDTARMTGSVTVNRLDFNVGQNMADESSVAFAVDIDVALTATRGE
ncbi:cytochrome b/b6 domain-containing protein [Lutimaribacter marinistellae]|uniref:Cytochrome b/b6 domain-containing protein n=1 Tax=Lutimaribacter marinistellae TaxID=1820329 RepID=A0ABV7THP4_9RHOB